MTDDRDPFRLPDGRPDPFAPRQAPAQRDAPRAGDEPPVDLRKPRPAGARDASEPAEPVRERRAKRRLKEAGGPLGIAALLIWKVGRVALVALGKVAILFKIPLLGTVLSGAVSIGAYAVFFGWPFAIGLVASLLVHELGHVIAIRREGMPIKALNFVPFLGAYVLSDAPRTADQQARISVAGPLAGTLLAVVIAVAAQGEPVVVAIAYTGFFLNLFNLLPIPMLDGGGVGSVLTAAWWGLVAAALAVVYLATGTGFAGIAALAAVVMVYLRRDQRLALDLGDGVPRRQRALAAGLYVAIIAVCAVGMAATFRDRTQHLVDQYGAAPARIAHQG